MNLKGAISRTGRSPLTLLPEKFDRFGGFADEYLIGRRRHRMGHTVHRNFGEAVIDASLYDSCCLISVGLDLRVCAGAFRIKA